MGAPVLARGIRNFPSPAALTAERMAKRMDRKATKIVILGAGRLGGALHRALTRAGFSSALASRPKTPLAVGNTREMLSRAAMVFLCVPDAQIGAAAEQYADVFHPEQLVAHCAGALTLSPLEPAALRGVEVGSLHPLCAIASPETSFLGIHAAVAGSSAAVRQKLSEVAMAAGMIPFDLSDADRARYHAAAALASNGLMALASLAAGLFESCGMDRKKSLSAMLPLMRSAVVAMDQKGLPAALTGPVARGDSDVVLGHLKALHRPGDDEVRRLYAELSVRLVALSDQLGAASKESLKTAADALNRELDALKQP